MHEEPTTSTVTPGPAPVTKVPSAAEVSIDVTAQAAGLTVIVDRDGEVLHLTLMSPHLSSFVNATIELPDDLGELMQSRFARFSSLARGVGVAGATAASGNADHTALMKGFGELLYEKIVPTEFKTAYWQLVDQLGSRFRSIMFVSNDPVIPWELVRPSRADDRHDFLGVQFRVGRWHLASPTQPLLPRPPQTMTLRSLFMIAPQYTGPLALPFQAHEISALEDFAGFSRVGGTYSALRDLFADLPGDSIIHFAGHGTIQEQSGAREYAIDLEDGSLDLTTWRGIANVTPGRHPIVFLNACNVGQANAVADFVDGWAPAVLDTGASAYIGGLWPLGDRGAANFSAELYTALSEKLASQSGQRTNSVALVDVLRETRKRFYENGDPTFLAYVYYGDPNLQVSFAHDVGLKLSDR